VKKWKSVHVAIAANRLPVGHHLFAHLPESLQAVARHQHQEMNALPAVEDQIVQELHVKFPKVVKSAIHAGLGPHHKNAINREYVHVSLNQIFLKM
jgi:hypothetical protein